MTAIQPSGLELIRAEIDRQHDDARALAALVSPFAGDIARSLMQTGRFILTGMGTSHFGNRIAEAALRQTGIDATAITTSEFLSAPLTPKRRTLLIVSQSGESGEIVAYLDRTKGGADEFALTLTPDSRLARSRPSLVLPGGPERAFAATRSVFLQIVSLAEICREIGVAVGSLESVLDQPAIADVGPAVERLAEASAFAVSARGILQGIAETAALNLVELARVPVIALEGGQFRHGPLELLGPGIGVILFRADDAYAERVGALATAIAATGSPTVVLDCSGDGRVAGTVAIRLPRASGFAAAVTLLPTLQQLVVKLASRFVENVGEPLRSSKVTLGV